MSIVYVDLVMQIVLITPFVLQIYHLAIRIDWSHSSSLEDSCRRGQSHLHPHPLNPSDILIQVQRQAVNKLREQFSEPILNEPVRNQTRSSTSGERRVKREGSGSRTIKLEPKEDNFM